MSLASERMHIKGYLHVLRMSTWSVVLQPFWDIRHLHRTKKIPGFLTIHQIDLFIFIRNFLTNFLFAKFASTTFQYWTRNHHVKKNTPLPPPPTTHIRLNGGLKTKRKAYYMLCIMHGSKKVGGGGCLIVKFIAENKSWIPHRKRNYPSPTPYPRQPRRGKCCFWIAHVYNLLNKCEVD